MRREELSLTDYLPILKKRTERVPGTAVFLTGQPDAVPTALMHNVKHNKILHSRIIIVAVTAADTPRVPEAERGSVRRISDDVSVVRLRFGFMEDPDIPTRLGTPPSRARDQSAGRRPTTCRAGRCVRRRGRGCPTGNPGCSSGSHGTPLMLRNTSEYQRIVPSRSARRSRSDGSAAQSRD